MNLTPLILIGLMVFAFNRQLITTDTFFLSLLICVAMVELQSIKNAIEKKVKK